MLPVKFINSMKVLFDILDDNQSGTVPVRCISSYWNGDQKVSKTLEDFADSEGCLTFENLCNAFKCVLSTSSVRSETLKRENDEKPKKEEKEEEENNDCYDCCSEPVKYGFQSFLSEPGMHNVASTNIDDDNNDNYYYTQSLKQKSDFLFKGDNSINKQPIISASASLRPPLPAQFNSKFSNRFGTNTRSISTNSLRDSNKNSKLSVQRSEGNILNENGRRRRRDLRRHTIGADNGNIDFVMIKRAKQLEEEYHLLEFGLAKIHEAKNWYERQIEEVKLKKKTLRINPENWSLSNYDDKLGLQTSRIQQLNKQIEALVLSSEKLPLHINLDLNKPNKQISIDNQNSHFDSQRLKLEEDVKRYKEKIIQLENDKQTLIKDVFEARTSTRKGIFFDDSTFM